MTQTTPTRDEAVQRIASLIDENADVYSENAMDRAFLGNSEELAGLIVDVLALTAPAPASIDPRKIAPADVVRWAVDRWNEQVKHRPLVNIHRRSLDDAWRRVMRDFGGDPDGLVGPPHDELHAACVPSPKGNEHIGAPAPASGRVDAVAWTRELEEAFRLAFEGYSKPADHFHDTHTWGCFILKRVSAIFTILQKMKREAGWPDLASLSPAATPVSEADALFWKPDRIGHVLADCATYLRTLYSRHSIKPKDHGIDPDKLDAASRAAYALAKPASSPAGGDVRRVRHKKRGGIYEVLGEAQVQTSRPLEDYEVVVIYRSLNTPFIDDPASPMKGDTWIRPKAEFNDGRFEELSQSTSGGRVGE